MTLVLLRRLGLQLEQQLYSKLSCTHSRKSAATIWVQRWVSSKPAHAGKTTAPPLPRASPTPAFTRPKQPTIVSVGPRAGPPARRTDPRLLFQAPTPFINMTWNYTLGAACFLFAGSNLYTFYYYPPQGIWYFIPIAMTGLCVVVCALGVYFILGSYRNVRSITSLPDPSGSVAGLRLAVESAKMFPFVGPRTVTLPFKDLYIHETVRRDPMVVEAERYAIEQESARRVEADKDKSILTKPFREASYWMWRGFKEVQHSIFKDQLVFANAKGYTLPWKLDTRRAWMLEDGRVLDEIVKRNRR